MKLLLIDGSYYAYRSFFAHGRLTNHRGEPTGAIYGMIKAIVRTLRDVQPTHAAVAWDSGSHKRSAMQPDYKGHRAGMPEELRAQLAFLKQVIPMMGVQGLSVPGTEADDIIAAYAEQSLESSADIVIIASADKDLLQLVNPQTLIYSTNKADRSEQGFALLGEADVIAKWGVMPDQIGDVLALMGDDGDNIKGVSGIGPKTAANLIAKHGDLNSLLANLAQVKGKTAQSIEAARDRVLQNREMVRLETDLPLPMPISSLKLGERTQEFEDAMRACDIRTENL